MRDSRAWRANGEPVESEHRGENAQRSGPRGNFIHFRNAKRNTKVDGTEVRAQSSGLRAQGSGVSWRSPQGVPPPYQGEICT
jgi:hypothetical protein